MRRIISIITILGSCGEFYWKLSGVELPGGDVPYCIGNLKGLAEKLNTESLITGVFEVITILSAFVLLALYERENRLRKSYDISVNLKRRQLISTMGLFLPYSIFHGLCFFSYSIISIIYREIFLNLEEPWYSTGSGHIFAPRYFTAISPWVLYWIV
ncbi:unnamed protein product, partial [Mesorhabditis belari]|uniref:Uncharacterized protein n=1 Tax=Mesorhabditis belari TaxID=2138241 RepID=A0AAF3J8U0_9BILA